MTSFGLTFISFGLKVNDSIMSAFGNHASLRSIRCEEGNATLNITEVGKISRCLQRPKPIYSVTMKDLVVSTAAEMKELELVGDAASSIP